MESDTKNSSEDTSTETSLKRIFMRAIYESSTFVITRYPYICAVLLMVSTAEQSMKNKISKGDFGMIYINLGVSFTSATMMAYDIFGMKRTFALITAVQLLVNSFQEYKLMKYGEQVTFRMIIRNFSTIGSYLMVAGGIAKNKGNADRNRKMVAFGRQMLGAFSILTAVLIWNSNEEFKIFIRVLPAGTISTYSIIIALIVSGVCIYSGYQVILACKCLSFLLFTITCTVDLSSKIWLEETGMDIWTSRSIACRHLPVVTVLLLVRRGYF